MARIVGVITLIAAALSLVSCASVSTAGQVLHGDALRAEGFQVGNAMTIPVPVYRQSYVYVYPRIVNTGSTPVTVTAAFMRQHKGAPDEVRITGIDAAASQQVGNTLGWGDAYYPRLASLPTRPVAGIVIPAHGWSRFSILVHFTITARGSVRAIRFSPCGLRYRIGQQAYVQRWRCGVEVGPQG